MLVVGKDVIIWNGFKKSVCAFVGSQMGRGNVEHFILKDKNGFEYQLAPLF